MEKTKLYSVNLNTPKPDSIDRYMEYIEACVERDTIESEMLTATTSKDAEYHGGRFVLACFTVGVLKGNL